MPAVAEPKTSLRHCRIFLRMHSLKCLYVEIPDSAWLPVAERTGGRTAPADVMKSRAALAGRCDKRWHERRLLGRAER